MRRLRIIPLHERRRWMIGRDTREQEPPGEHVALSEVGVAHGSLVVHQADDLAAMRVDLRPADSLDRLAERGPASADVIRHEDPLARQDGEDRRLELGKSPVIPGERLWRREGVRLQLDEQKDRHMARMGIRPGLHLVERRGERRHGGTEVEAGAVEHLDAGLGELVGPLQRRRSPCRGGQLQPQRRGKQAPVGVAVAVELEMPQSERAQLLVERPLRAVDRAGLSRRRRRDQLRHERIGGHVVGVVRAEEAEVIDGQRLVSGRGPQQERHRHQRGRQASLGRGGTKRSHQVPSPFLTIRRAGRTRARRSHRSAARPHPSWRAPRRPGVRRPRGRRRSPSGTRWHP